MNIMTLPVDTQSYDYKFNKTLNEDVRLISNTYGKYDLDMENGDYINVTGINSLQNACIIAILTRYRELKQYPYDEFGSKIHDRIKANKNRFQIFKIEAYLTETLNNMRRIKTVDDFKLIEDDTHSFLAVFTVTSINDETVKGKVAL